MLSRILDEVHLGGGLERPSPWYEYLSEPEKHNVTLKKASEVDELSDYELKVLGQTFEKFGRMNRWALVEFTHTLPEWTDPQGSSRPIDPVEILREAGESIEEVSRFLDHSSLTVTTTYLRRLEGQEDKGWEKVAEAIGLQAI